MMRFLCVGAIVCVLAANAVVVGDAQTNRQRSRRRAVVCGDLTARCQSDRSFQPYDIAFRIPPGAVIFESETFYAVILKSIRARGDYGADCEIFIPENERLAAQQLFPRNKVFTSRCIDAGSLYYENVSPASRFMGVYAGSTRASADKMLATVRATGKFPAAYIRSMRVGVNGT